MVVLHSFSFTEPQNDLCKEFFISDVMMAVTLCLAHACNPRAALCAVKCNRGKHSVTFFFCLFKTCIDGNSFFTYLGMH